jgi:hypothetical protein
MRGEVVGIVTSKINAVALYKWTGDLPQNVNYATKTAYVWALLDSVEEEYPYDGVHEVKEGSLEGLTERIKKSILVVVAE